MKTLLSFHGKRAIKDFYVKRVEEHAKADQIIKGKYWENGRGCAVGCVIHSANHSAYETELGLPEWLARLQDRIFEGLPIRSAKDFAVDFLQVIPVGVNLESVKWKFCAFILKENIEHVLSLKISDNIKKKVVDAIRGCLVLHEKAIKECKFAAESAAWSTANAAKNAAWNAAANAAESAASAAASAAESAAKGAAKSAAWNAAKNAAESAASAAESAAESAAWSAPSAAWSAAASAAASAAESATWSTANAAKNAAWNAAKNAAWNAAKNAAWNAAASAAESAAKGAAKSAAYKKYAEKLLKILAEAQ